MSKVAVVYFHGLGRTELRPGERRILKKYEKMGALVLAPHLDYCSEESFPDMLERVANDIRGLLKQDPKLTKLVIKGSSAGGSLAFNAFSLIDDPRLYAHSHSGRLRAGDYPPGSLRSLERCAHLGTPRASQSFYDSVRYFESEVAPHLTDEQKARMLITMPWWDEVVPVATMPVPGVPIVSLKAVGHAASIGLGMWQTRDELVQAA